MIPRAKFDGIRAQIHAARERRDDLERVLRLKWQEPRWAPRAQQAKLQRLRAAYDRQVGRMHKLLEASPRDWSRGIPSHWVAEKLSYADATRPTSEPLSVEPPKAWGY